MRNVVPLLALVMRIAAPCALAFFATSAVADDDDVQYSYTFQTIEHLHFCDFHTTIVHVPMLIKLTAAIIGDDTKPADHNIRVMYIVEAFDIVPGKQTQFELKEVKVLSGRIISNVFNTDLMASKNDDNRPSLGASYSITREGFLALFYNLMVQSGTYTLAVELENQPILGLDVKPTPKMGDPVTKWLECSIAVSRNKLPVATTAKILCAKEAPDYRRGFPAGKAKRASPLNSCGEIHAAHASAPARGFQDRA